MKTHWITKLIVAAIVATLTARGVNVYYYWSGAGDSNEGGNGTWDTTTGHWGTAAPYNNPWDNTTMASDIAAFRGTAGTVDVQSAGIVCRRLNVTVSGYWIKGGKITSDAYNNNFVIDKSAANWVRIDNDIDLITNNPATINIRIRNSGGLSQPLVVGGTIQFLHNSGTKYLDLDGTGSSGSRIDFTGGLADTAGATIRLRMGNNSGNDASVYNLSGTSTHAGGTFLTRGTVNISSSTALGSGLFVLTQSGTPAGATVRVNLVGNVSVPNGFQTANGSGVVRAIIGKAAGDTGEAVIQSGNVDANADNTRLVFDIVESAARIRLDTQLYTSSTIRPAVKLGNGTLILNAGVNNYQSEVHVSNGTMLVHGTLPSTVIVAANGKLGGRGKLSGSVTVSGGTIAPGESVGTNWYNNLTLGDGSVYEWEIGPSQASHDLIVVTNLTIGSGVTIQVKPLGSVNPPGLSVTCPVFAVVTSISGVNNLSLDLSQTVGWTGEIVTMADGQSVGLVLTPEPGVLGLTLVAGLLALRKRG